MDAIEIAERDHGAMGIGGQIGFVAIKTHQDRALETGAYNLDGFAARLKIAMRMTTLVNSGKTHRGQEHYSVVGAYVAPSGASGAITFEK
jgi:hypothetical protein